MYSLRCFPDFTLKCANDFSKADANKNKSRQKADIYFQKRIKCDQIPCTQRRECEI